VSSPSVTTVVEPPSSHPRAFSPSEYRSSTVSSAATPRTSAECGQFGTGAPCAARPHPYRRASADERARARAIPAIRRSPLLWAADGLTCPPPSECPLPSTRAVGDFERSHQPVCNQCAPRSRELRALVHAGEFPSLSDRRSAPRSWLLGGCRLLGSLTSLTSLPETVGQQRCCGGLRFRKGRQADADTEGGPGDHRGAVHPRAPCHRASGAASRASVKRRGRRWRPV
jgi:hypothetical protein